MSLVKKAVPQTYYVNLKGCCCSCIIGQCENFVNIIVLSVECLVLHFRALHLLLQWTDTVLLG
jgi:hypothetical protein